MNEISFAPKEIIPPGHHVIEIVSAETTEAYGPQLALKLKVVGGEHADHTFTDYANRDEDTGQIKQGSKGWAIFEACCGADFYKRGVGLQALVGKRFVAKVEQTKTGSRNKLEHGTIGPLPPEVAQEEPERTPNPDGEADEEDLANIPI
jgi:hypothetical protein